MYEFKLEPEEIKNFLKWSKSLPITKDVAGTQFVFQFIPTGIGLIKRIKCLVTNKELDLTDYDSW